MKKLFSLTLVLGLALVLVACGNKQSNSSSAATSSPKTENSTSSNSMDGTYYRVGHESLGALNNVVVDGKRLKSVDYGNFSINFEDKTLIGEGGEISFDYKNDTIYIDEDEYVKVGSERFKKLQQDGLEVDNG